MKKQRKLLEKTILIALAGVLHVHAAVGAEEAKFTLEETVITAQREETKELSTPTYVNILTKEKLAVTGAKTLIEALQFTQGLVVTSPGPYGMSHNRTSSSVIIRGARKGALVLVNGSPLTLGGSYNLDRFPVSQIERVEIIKGAAATLYGTDASGGVINIITKEKVENSISVNFSGKNAKNVDLSFQADKLALSFFYKKSGEVDRISSDDTHANKYYYSFEGGEKYGFSANYKFNEYWNLRLEQGHDDIDRKKIADTSGLIASLLNDRSAWGSLQLAYNQNNWKVNLYGQYRNNPFSETYLLPFHSAKTSGETRNTGLGFDAQKSWEQGKIHYLGGVTWYNEKYKQYNLLTDKIETGPFSRNQYSAYLQAKFDTGSKTHIIVGARQQYAEMKDIQKSIFCPQLQITNDIDADKTWFINIGKSFRLPTFYEGYVSAAPDLKPESGWSYEVGFKRRTQRDTFTTSLFALDLKDYIVSEIVKGIGMSKNYPQYVNQGLELNWEHQATDNWYYNLGAVISNPRQKDNHDKWVNADNKLQVTSVIGYKRGAFNANLSAGWLGDRAYSAPDSLLVNLVFNYSPSDKIRWTLSVINLLNRQDVIGYGGVTGNTATYYYGAPRTLHLNYSYSF